MLIRMKDNYSGSAVRFRQSLYRWYSVHHQAIDGIYLQPKLTNRCWRLQHHMAPAPALVGIVTGMVMGQGPSGATIYRQR